MRDLKLLCKPLFDLWSLTPPMTGQYQRGLANVNVGSGPGTLLLGSRFLGARNSVLGLSFDSWTQLELRLGADDKEWSIPIASMSTASLTYPHAATTLHSPLGIYGAGATRHGRGHSIHPALFL